jgi:hypothetical protein
MVAAIFGCYRFRSVAVLMLKAASAMTPLDAMHHLEQLYEDDHLAGDAKAEVRASPPPSFSLKLSPPRLLRPAVLPLTLIGV